MIVDRLEARELGDLLERSARVRFGDGAEVRLRAGAPPELAGEHDDASPFVPLCLLAAMSIGEDLTVDGAVSPRLLRGLRRARELWGAWSPALRRSDIEVSERRECTAGGREIASFFSRGVDSTYTAATPRAVPGTIDRLVFITGFEHEHDADVRQEEVRRAGLAAERIGLPLSVASTNLYELAARTIGNADDHTAPALALTGLALGGGIGTMVVPSSDSTQTLGPEGTNPALDPLLSTEAVSMEHDSVAVGRVGKALWIAHERPELLAQLKVCYHENRPDNCGHCSKCLLTMATLRAAGALQAAEQFPDEIDLDALRAMTLGGFQPRIEAAELIASIDSGRDPELHDAAMSMMAQPMPPYPGAPPRTDTPDFRRRHNTLLLSVMRDRLPWPPEDAIGMPRGAGLVRVVDRRRQLHVYGVGRVPPGELVGELGRLPSEGARGLAPLWITAGGYLTTEEARVAPRPASPAAAARWALAPLAWRDVEEPLAERVRASLGRLAVVRRERRREPRSAEPVATVAHIHRDDNGGARPTLYSAVHSVTGDQLLTTNRFEAGDLGYGDPLVLGYLDPDAPVTGRLGTSRPRIPWASRFGLRVRGPDGRIA